MKKNHLNVGHIGLLDSTPLLVAREHGYFEDEGLTVTLSCELGLATICGKLSESRLDGACLPVQLPLLLSAGAGVPRVAMQAPMITSYQGTSIMMVKSRHTAKATDSVMRIGVIAPGTSAKLFLQRHQQLSGSTQLADAVLIPTVASQLIDFFKDGMFDGFCGIDPLPGLAAIRPEVVKLTDSAALFPMHPGSVAALRTEVMERNPRLVESWMKALGRACEFCTNPANHQEVWRLLFLQCPYMELTAAERAPLIKPLSGEHEGGSSIRFVPGNKAGVRGVDPDGFIEAACRSALGANLRGLDIKAEIARVYGLKSLSLAASKA